MPVSPEDVAELRALVDEWSEPYSLTGEQELARMLERLLDDYAALTAPKVD